MGNVHYKYRTDLNFFQLFAPATDSKDMVPSFPIDHCFIKAIQETSPSIHPRICRFFSSRKSVVLRHIPTQTDRYDSLKLAVKTPPLFLGDP